MRTSSTGLLVLIWIAVWCGPARSQQSGEHPIQEDLKDLRKDLRRERRLYERLKQESTSLLGTMSELDQQVGKAEGELEETEDRMRSLEQQLEDYRVQRQQAAWSLVALRKRQARRLRALYMMGEVGWANLVFGAGSISEGLQRYQILKRMAVADQSLAGQVTRSRDMLAQTEMRIRDQKAALESTSQQVRKRQEQATAMRDEQRHALELVNKKTALRKRAVSELKRARGRLTNLVSSIEGKASAAKGFASWRGRLPVPVKGGRVDQEFGRQVDERFGTVTLHQGVDIRAPKLTPVQAVYPGKVAFAGVFQGYGRLVIIDHGGGYYTLYGHLDSFRVAKGGKVTQGQQVGSLGETGSLKGPYLYFEVRQGGRAVNPASWVRLKRG